jgi:hypothetical protein
MPPSIIPSAPIALSVIPLLFSPLPYITSAPSINLSTIIPPSLISALIIPTSITSSLHDPFSLIPPRKCVLASLVIS